MKTKHNRPFLQPWFRIGSVHDNDYQTASWHRHRLSLDIAESRLSGVGGGSNLISCSVQLLTALRYVTSTLVTDMLTRPQFDAACKAFIARHNNLTLDSAFKGWTWHEHTVCYRLQDSASCLSGNPELSKSWLHVSGYGRLSSA